MNKYLWIIVVVVCGLGLILIPNSIVGIIVKSLLFIGLVVVVELGYMQFPLLGKSTPSKTEPERVSDPAPATRKPQSVEEAFDSYVESFLVTSKAMLNLHSAVFYLFHEGKKVFKFKSGVSDHYENLVKSSAVGTDKGLIHLMVKNKNDVVENNLNFEPRFLSYYEKSLNITGSAALFPVFYKNTIVGVVIYDSEDPRAFTSGKIELAKRAVSQMEQYFVNSNSLYELKAESERNQAFIKIANSFNKLLTTEAIWEGAVQFVRDYIKYDRLIISLTHTGEPKDADLQYIKLVNGMEGNFRTDQEFGLNDGIFAWCILNKRPFMLNDAFKRQTPVYLFSQTEKGALQTRSILVMPIYTDNGIYGGIALESQYPYQFTDGDKLFLDFLCRQIAFALEKAARFEHLTALIQKDLELGVWNYQSFIDKLSEEMGRSNRFNSSFATVLFKFNFHSSSLLQSFDQPTRVIKETLAVVQKNSRQIDYFARLDQFHVVVLLYEADINGARTYAEKVMGHVRDSVGGPSEKYAVSLNACITQYPGISAGLDDLVFSLKRGINIAVENGPFTVYEIVPGAEGKNN